MVDVDIQGENANLISYGPIFGIEAQENLKAALSSLGLVEIDDLYGLDFFLPEWARMGEGRACR
jgi:glycerol-3-phosphate dehydrogenase